MALGNTKPVKILARRRALLRSDFDVRVFQDVVVAVNVLWVSLLNGNGIGDLNMRLSKGDLGGTGPGG